MKEFLQNSRVGLHVGMIVSGMAIALGFLVPMSLSSLVADNCRPDDWDSFMMVCDPIRPWVSFIQFLLSTIGFLFSGVWLGIGFGLVWATRANRGFWKTFLQVTIASSTMLAVFMLFEVVWYQPWITEPYNRFELNRIFTTVFGILVPFSAMFGCVVTIIFTKRLWKSFEPIGFRKQKKTV